MKIFFVIVFATFACAGRAAGCDLCAIYMAGQARGEIGRGIFAGIAEQFTHMGTVQVDGREVPNPSGQYLDSSISQLFLGYNFSESFGVQFNLPLIYRSFKRPDGAGSIDQGTESGLGDVSLLGTLFPYRYLSENLTFNWSVVGGVKFPTGNSDRISEELHEIEDPVGPPSGIHGHDLTLGTGSYDGIVGSGIFARWDKAFFSGTLQYAIRTKGDFDYEFANDLTWSAGPGYYVALRHRYTLSVQLLGSGEYKDKDRFQGEPAEDTAVTSVYLGPQITFTLGINFSAYLGADFPIRIDNSSLQTVPDYRIRGGLNWHF